MRIILQNLENLTRTSLSNSLPADASVRSRYIGIIRFSSSWMRANMQRGGKEEVNLPQFLIRLTSRNSINEDEAAGITGSLQNSGF